jgi:ankyrin repeat protein
MTRRILSFVLLTLLFGGCSQLEEPTISWYLAVVRGDIEQVERHIHWDTDVNAPFPNGRYPLHEAAEKGRVIMLRLLLENGAKTDVKEGSQLTPLELAVLAGRTQAAEVLLKADAALAPSRLLLIAAERDVKDRDTVRFLKAQGADFETTDERGNTPLMLAVERHNHRLTHHLVEQAANVNAANKDGKTPLLIAEQIGASELAGFLQRNGAVRSIPAKP